MDYSNRDITSRAEDSPLWEELSSQSGQALPFLLERYLLLENWNISRDPYEDRAPNTYDISYLHLLLANATTVLLNQEERIRKLENLIENGPKSS